MGACPEQEFISKSIPSLTWGTPSGNDNADHTWEKKHARFTL